MSDNLNRRDEIRLVVLKHTYDETIGKLRDSEGTIFDAPSIAEDVPFTEQEISSALDYLEGKGLVRGGGPQFIGEQRFYRNYNIKHSGINEIEQALRAPGHGTEHFPPPATLNIYGNVGAVQTGSHATANVTQSIGPDLSSIFTLIEQLKQQTSELSEDDQDEAQIALHELETELRDKKEPTKLRVLCKQLGRLAQGVAVGTSFGANATTLITQLPPLLSF